MSPELSALCQQGYIINVMLSELCHQSYIISVMPAWLYIIRVMSPDLCYQCMPSGLCQQSYVISIIPTGLYYQGYVTEVCYQRYVNRVILSGICWGGVSNKFALCWPTIIETCKPTKCIYKRVSDIIVPRSYKKPNPDLYQWNLDYLASNFILK